MLHAFKTINKKNIILIDKEPNNKNYDKYKKRLY